MQETEIALILSGKACRPMILPRTENSSPLNSGAKFRQQCITKLDRRKCMRRSAVMDGRRRCHVSHAHTVVWGCCKDDQQSQWEMLKFDPQLPLNPLSDRRQIWHAW